MRTLAGGAAALVATILMSAAWAADSNMTHADPAYWLSRIDTDRNGSVSREEFDAGRTKMFKTVDTNGDGTVTTAERRAAVDKWNRDRPNQEVRISDDRLKEVSLNAFTANTTILFDKLDTDKDGKVSQGEMDRAHVTGEFYGLMDDNLGGAGNTGGPTGSGAPSKKK